jgi:transcriptional regulator with XRE-family HTH domain
MNFSEIFKKLRGIEKLTQMEFADKLSLSRSAIAQIENGNNNPSTDVIIRMLKVFDLPDDLKKDLDEHVSGNRSISEEEKDDSYIPDGEENISYNKEQLWDTYVNLVKNKKNILCLCILLKENKYEFSVDERNKLLKIETAISYLGNLVFGRIRFREYIFKKVISDLRTSNELIEDFTNTLLPSYSNTITDFKDII